MATYAFNALTLDALQRHVEMPNIHVEIVHMGNLDNGEQSRPGQLGSPATMSKDLLDSGVVHEGVSVTHGETGQCQILTMPN